MTRRKERRPFGPIISEAVFVSIPPTDDVCRVERLGPFASSNQARIGLHLGSETIRISPIMDLLDLWTLRGMYQGEDRGTHFMCDPRL